jgi:hypothetical protein
LCPGDIPDKANALMTNFVPQPDFFMRISLLLFFIFTGYPGLLAQDSTLVTIKTGYKVTEVLTPADIYYYPQFTNGKVFFKDGAKAVAQMNYSHLFDQILFIGRKGDTLALADEKTIKFITIDRDTFYYDEGYMRLITDGAVKLAGKQIWVVADIQKIGTHNRPTSTVAITSFSSYTDGSDAAKSKDLILNEDIILRKETHYYFGDKFDQFIRATKKDVLKFFHKNQQRIEEYLKENKPNFDKKDDLEKLAQFLSQFD